MRAALWLISLFALAVAGAWIAGNNQGTVTLFLSPHRVDVSLNLAVLVLLAVVLLVVLAQKALEALLSLPQQARRWRIQQKERASHAALLDSMAYFMAGRFLRARKSAEQALEKESLLSNAGLVLDHSTSLRALAHVMAAEACHALQDKERRQHHLAQAALQAQRGQVVAERQTLTEGIQLRAARWLIDDRDAQASLVRLKALPPAVGRRMAAMRLQLKAARLAGQSAQALDTAVMLAKHGAFSPTAAHSLVVRLVLALIADTHDAEAVQKMWLRLSSGQRLMPEVAAEAALRLLSLGGAPWMARQWLQPLWEPALACLRHGDVSLRLVQAFEASWVDFQADDARVWLSQVEGAQQAQPRDPHLQYLAGMLCLRHRLWGKAQGLLGQSVKGLNAPVLQRKAWVALAEMAEQRQEPLEASAAWKQAALISLS